MSEHSDEYLRGWRDGYGAGRDDEAAGGPLRNGIDGCWCCGTRHVDAGGWCGSCRARGHHLESWPPRRPRQQAQSPRDRQIRHPGRDR